MRNAAATALLTSLLLALVAISLAVSDHAQTGARLDQRLALQADGEASAVGGLFTRTRLALSLLTAEPAFRDGLAGGGAEASPGMARALGSLERAEPSLAGAASAIGLDGRERARVVRGEAAPAEALARDVREQPFFRAALGARPGGVAVSRPYRSADTGAWVVSNAALVRDASGVPVGIVRFELALASVRQTAIAALRGKHGVQVALIDRASGSEILDTSGAILDPGAPADATDGRIATSERGHGMLSSGGRRLAYRALGGVPSGLGWIVVAEGPQPSLLAAAGISAGVLVLLGVALALAAAGLVLLRQRQRSEAEALLAAEGGRAEAEQRTRMDALTGLYNRRHMLDAITAELARSDRTGVPPSVLLLDLDGFQRINDAYGQAVGDRVLAEIANRLQGRLRGYDVVGRWGGDEFIVLVPGVPDDETLRRLADQIRRLVGTLPVAVRDEPLLPVTVSIGAVRAGDALRSVEGLTDCADRALAAAKRRGRDRVQLFGDLTVEDLVAEEPEPIRLARALALSASVREELPHADAERISDLAAAIAEQLGLDEAAVTRCRLGGLLHDIGTAAVGDRILSLVGPPTARDRLAYEDHVGAGGRLVRSVAGVSEVAAIVEAHEEWFDGTGYPLGLSEDEIPLESRIVACAAAYVGLAQIVGGEEAADGLRRQAGSALDPAVVIAALALLTRDPGHPARRLRDVPTI
jgi:diguanylate cyclase (GGDEF)-like protein